MKTIILLLCFSSSTVFTTVNAQNVKKIFKYIEKGNIEDAVLELEKKTNSNEKYDRKEILLIQLGNCLILSNQKCQSFKPYEAYQLFKSVSISNLESNEVEDFLSKYDLNLIKVSDLIFQGILIEAKKINSEASYDAALYVCKPCYYDLEVRDLKSKAAYNECINKGTVEGYKYFIEMYANTEYLNEVTDLLNKKAFDEACITMTIESMNNFINNYSNSLFKNSAIEIRDSLALPSKQKNYTSLLKYTKQYPNSKYTPKIIRELPDILYNEALTKNTVELLKRFVTDYPNDERVIEIKNNLEIVYYNILKKCFSIKEFNSFKSQFPNSAYVNELNSISIKLMENSDLFKEGFKGDVKTVETSIYDYREKKNIFSSKKEYNEFGKIKTFNSTWDFWDKIEDFEMSYMPKEFDDEFLIVLPFGRTKSTLHIGNKKEYGFGRSTNLSFIYNIEGGLVSVYNKKFIYDADRNLIEKNYYNNSTPGVYSSTVDGWAINKIKYKWRDGKLISKYEYNDKGDRYDYFYDIEYTGNQQNIYVNYGGESKYTQVYTNSGQIINGVVSKYTLVYNASNQIISKSYDWYCSNYRANDSKFRNISLRKFEYTNGFLTKITCVENEYYNNSSLAIKLGENPNEGIVKETKKSQLNIKRDANGNILYIDEDTYGRNQFSHNTEWTYEYDNYGNWNKRTEFDVKIGDIKIIKKTNEVTRIITYN